MVIISILSFELYCELTNKKGMLQPLIGNETIYPECFSEFLIPFFIEKTRYSENMRNYYFRVTKNMDKRECKDECKYEVKDECKDECKDGCKDECKYEGKDESMYLQPKYTHNTYELSFHYLVVVSDEVYKQSFNQGQKESLEVVYDILSVDVLELQKLDGDYPQNSSIDSLLTDFLESSTIMNLGQEFTLAFKCNAHLFKNYITFKVNGIVCNPPDKLINALNDAFNNALNNPVESICMVTHPYSDAIDFISIKPYKDDVTTVGLVANNEVKIHFLEDCLNNCLNNCLTMPLQKARAEKEELVVPIKEIFKTKGLQLDSSASNPVPLSKEEIRRLRTKKFNNE